MSEKAATEATVNEATGVTVTAEATGNSEVTETTVTVCDRGDCVFPALNKTSLRKHMFDYHTPLLTVTIDQGKCKNQQSSTLY